MTEITGRTEVVAVVGDPIGHSLSPTIHNAAFQASGLDWIMVPCRVLADAGNRVLDAASALGLRGLAVTTPHKQVVAETVDHLDDAAASLRSVNTVVIGEDATTGYSTDGEGFVAALAAADFDVSERRVVVIGAGAAARSVIDALGRHGCASIGIVNRTESAARSASQLASVAEWVPADQIAERVVDAELVVNATSVGMGADVSVLDSGLFTPQHLVVDVVYHPVETRFLRDAQDAGARTLDGLGMLVHQAALQHALWTGCSADVSSMWSAVQAVLHTPR